jgi:hypothetical protein
MFHQQAVAEHWEFPNTEIFQSKDVVSGVSEKNFITVIQSQL